MGRNRYRPAERKPGVAWSASRREAASGIDDDTVALPLVRFFAASRHSRPAVQEDSLLFIQFFLPCRRVLSLQEDSA